MRNFHLNLISFKSFFSTMIMVGALLFTNGQAFSQSTIDIGTYAVNESYTDAFNACVSALEDMSFTLEKIDEDNGMIQASQNSNVLELRFLESNNNSNMVKIQGTFSQDSATLVKELQDKIIERFPALYSNSDN